MLKCGPKLFLLFLKLISETVRRLAACSASCTVDILFCSMSMCCRMIFFARCDWPKGFFGKSQLSSQLTALFWLALRLLGGYCLAIAVRTYMHFEWLKGYSLFLRKVIACPHIRMGETKLLNFGVLQSHVTFILDSLHRGALPWLQLRNMYMTRTPWRLRKFARQNKLCVKKYYPTMHTRSCI
jgi:hypothetical protein